MYKIRITKIASDALKRLDKKTQIKIIQRIDELKKSDKLEGYARQKYFMKRPNEDIYIIEFDEK